MKKYKYFIVAGLMILLSGLITFLYPFASLRAENETRGRIAYVDVWAVFNAHPQKAIAEKKLNQIAQSMQLELEKKAKDLPKDKQQEMLKEYQSKLNRQEQELIQEIIDAIEEVIQTVAREKEVKIVLDKKNVIYGGYDMTQDVINYIEKNFKSATSGEDASEDTADTSGASGTLDTTGLSGEKTGLNTGISQE